MSSASRQVVVPNRQGLHARPIAMIAEAATRFGASFEIEVEGNTVDGRSILQLMTLCASQGSTLQLRAEGEDAEDLVAAVAAIVERGFGED